MINLSIFVSLYITVCIYLSHVYIYLLSPTVSLRLEILIYPVIVVPADVYCCQKSLNWSIQIFVLYFMQMIHLVKQMINIKGKITYKLINIIYSNLLSCLVVQSCPNLYDPMDCSTPGFPVLYHLPCSNSCPLIQWCHKTILSSVVHFSSCL